MKTSEILDLKFYSGDLNKTVTVRQFFYKLLRTLWDEGESFSGKRPFGNSGWKSGFSCWLDTCRSFRRRTLMKMDISKAMIGQSHTKLIAEEIIPAIFNQIEV